MSKIRIGNKLIGKNEPCFIIAEAGVNHNGDIKIARKLIDYAKDAGADAVKFQTFRAEDVVTEEAPMAAYQQKNLSSKDSQLEMLRKLELDSDDFEKLKEYCDEKGIIFLSTPHSGEAVDFLDPLVPAFKIGSADLTNIPFLEMVAEKCKPMILGTGMSTLDEVKEALDVIYGKNNKQVILLHSTTCYPCSVHDVNLRAMSAMQSELNCLVGYSDHTIGLTVPVIAATLGAVVIEKHFTLDRNMQGPDHKASIEPGELESMVQVVKDVENALGDSDKRPTKSEEEIKPIVRKSIVARQDLQSGTVLTKELVAVKRPGNGLSPKYLNKILGKKLSKPVKKDDQLELSVLE